jgi:hypothetical protein
LSVTYASVVSCIGLALLFLGSEIFHFGELGGEFPSILLGDDVVFPVKGSRFICGMAFLGAYMWGIQDAFRRYTLNDLTPALNYSRSVRMILAAVVALLFYNGYGMVDIATDDGSGGGLTSQVWPVLAFLIGMFPQRGLHWLAERLPFLSSGTSTTVRETPLEMIEGIEIHDKMRLQELGIDTCYDLAVADFVPMILNTSYSARQPVDWILQAKLCIYFADAVKDLRQLGIRTIIDLEHLTQKDVEALARDTAVTVPALQRDQKRFQDDVEIKRLRSLGQSLGRFTRDEDEI